MFTDPKQPQTERPEDEDIDSVVDLNSPTAD